jgi:hypothetical protein
MIAGKVYAQKLLLREIASLQHADSSRVGQGFFDRL